MHSVLRASSASALLLILALAVAAAQQTPPTFRSGRDVLTVEAFVRDDSGRPVPDLQPQDFVVKVDGQSRRVITSRMFGTDANRLTNAAAVIPKFARAAAAPGRVVVMAIDRDSIRSGSERPVVETAARMLDQLSPADAVAAVGLPAGGVDVTRDRNVVSDAIRLMTGTRPPVLWEHHVAWEEALAFERGDSLTTASIVERECRATFDSQCPADLSRQAAEMLLVGRGHAQTILTRLTQLLADLAPIRAPKHLVLISGGMPFDASLLSRYRDLATRAAQSRVSLFVVNLDQASFDASDRGNFSTVFGGRDYSTGLANIASSTGGAFFNATARATGVFDQIATDLSTFYELGVESSPSDADGKTHRLEVSVVRAGLSVRNASEIEIAGSAALTAVRPLDGALLQPTDVADLPLEVATYVTHGAQVDRLRLLLSAALGGAGTPPSEWGYVVTDGRRSVVSGRVKVESGTPSPWAATVALQLPPGRYRLRVAAVDAERRAGSLDLPLTVGLRTAQDVMLSDLIVGTSLGAQVQPAPRIRQDESAVAMVELSAPTPLDQVTGTLEILRAGAAQASTRVPLVLRTRPGDSSIVLAQAAIDVSTLPPADYTASAVFARSDQPFARVSRVFTVVLGVAAPAPAVASPPAAPTAPTDAGIGAVMARVGRYVAGYGEQASLLVGVEVYNQRFSPPILGQPSGRRLTSEFALVKTNAGAWVGFRDVVEQDGRAVADRRDRLLTLFRSGTPDVTAARRIADESARYNIGPVTRNFNVPTAALFFFAPDNLPRFAFSKRGETMIDNVRVWQVEFKERASPSLIRRSDGHDVPSHGTLWLNPVDGTVIRTQLFVNGFIDFISAAHVDVRYARDDRLGLWLPATMTETYKGVVTDPRNSLGSTPRIVGDATGVATYSQFKRFETSGTVK